MHIPNPALFFFSLLRHHVLLASLIAVFEQVAKVVHEIGSVRALYNCPLKVGSYIHITILVTVVCML